MTYEQVIQHPLAQLCTIRERSFLKAYAQTHDPVQAMQAVYPTWRLESCVNYLVRIRNRKAVSSLMLMLDGGLEASEENIETLAMVMAQRGDTPKERTEGLKIAKQISDSRKAERAESKLKGGYKRDLTVLNNPPHKAKRSS